MADKLINVKASVTLSGENSSKRTITVSKLMHTATDEGIHSFGTAISDIATGSLEAIKKIKETQLV